MTCAVTFPPAAPNAAGDGKSHMDEQPRHHGPRFRARAGILAVLGTVAVGLGIYCLFTGFWNGAWICLTSGTTLLARWLWMMITGQGG